MNYARAMIQLIGTSIPWTCGDTYASIRMLDATPKPSEADLDAAWQVYLDTPRTRQWSTSEFFARLTPAERVAMVLSDDPQMRVLRYTLSLHPTVESDNADLLAGLNYAVALGLITAERVVEMLSGE